MMRILLALVFSLSLICGCTRVSTENFPELYELNAEIAKSINVPIHYGDTLIYEPYFSFCGNSSQAEIDRFFVPQIDSLPLISILQSNYKGVVLVLNNKIDSLMNRECNDNPDSLTMGDCYSKNKIILSISGQAISNKSVEINERYDYNNEYCQVDKIFTFKSGHWTHKVMQRTELTIPSQNEDDMDSFLKKTLQ